MSEYVANTTWEVAVKSLLETQGPAQLFLRDLGEGKLHSDWTGSAQS